MKREDLRSNIIPTTISNTDNKGMMRNKKFNTTDLIYLDSSEEQHNGEKTAEQMRISATDYACMNNAFIDHYNLTRTGKASAQAWYRDCWARCYKDFEFSGPQRKWHTGV